MWPQQWQVRPTEGVKTIVRMHSFDKKVGVKHTPRYMICSPHQVELTNVDFQVWKELLGKCIITPTVPGFLVFVDLGVQQQLVDVLQKKPRVWSERVDVIEYPR